MSWKPTANQHPQCCRSLKLIYRQNLDLISIFLNYSFLIHRNNSQIRAFEFPRIILGMTCKVRTGKQSIPFLFLVIDNCSHFSSDELIKPRQRYKKIFNISFVLNKKVLILFNTMDKMNKISTFVPHLSVIQHLFPHFTGNDNSLYATMNRSLV